MVGKDINEVEIQQTYSSSVGGLYSLIFQNVHQKAFASNFQMAVLQLSVSGRNTHEMCFNLFSTPVVNTSQIALLCGRAIAGARIINVCLKSYIQRLNSKLFPALVCFHHPAVRGDVTLVLLASKMRIVLYWFFQLQ